MYLKLTIVYPEAPCGACIPGELPGFPFSQILLADFKRRILWPEDCISAFLTKCEMVEVNIISSKDYGS